jgi:hypothetical protein
LVTCLFLRSLCYFFLFLYLLSIFSLFGLLYLFLKNKRRMRSPRYLFLSLCIPP